MTVPLAVSKQVLLKAFKQWDNLLTGMGILRPQRKTMLIQAVMLEML